MPKASRGPEPTPKSTAAHDSEPPSAPHPSSADVGAASRGVFTGGGEMGARMRALDWNATPLGPPDQWPQSLRAALSICLNSAYPIALYWGPDLALLYNDAWSPILGTKHPWALGRSGREVWPEIWDAIGPLFERVAESGEGVWQQDELLLMHRHGYTEECYFNFTFSPIRGESGRVEGIFNAVVETTYRVIGERRARVLRELAENVAGVRSAQEACALATDVLRSAATDVPFALLYLVDERGETARLGGVAGLEGASATRPDNISLTAEDGDGNIAALERQIARVARTGTAERVDDLAGELGALPTGPWDEAPHTALVLPVTRGGQARPVGVLVAGVSPRRSLDDNDTGGTDSGDEYRNFFAQVAAHVATSVLTAREYEEERRRAEALAELDRAKTTFFSNVSHELRTPLTLMLGPTEDLLAGAAGELPSAALEQLALVHRNEVRLLKLVNTLLDFSRIEAGRVEAVFEQTDLATYTAELASTFRAAVERAGLVLTIDTTAVADDAPPVYVDRDMWEKIVLNLLSNAFKHTFEGTIAVAVRVSDTGAELSVSDTGVGIPSAELPHLFERFRRVPNARSRTHEGTGIGLALVQELVRLHGGEIIVMSREGEGSTFTVRLPVGSKALSRDTVAARRERPSTSVGAAAYAGQAMRWLPDATPDAQRGLDPLGSQSIAPTLDATNATDAANPLAKHASSGRVLFVDDNADMREYAARLLRNAGWAVETATDGLAALDAVRERRPDLVVSDVMMPRLDGFGLLRALRDDPETMPIPVILLSARAGEESRVEGLDAGADDYLVKPFSARELVARVRAHLTLAQARRHALMHAERLRALGAALVGARTAADVASISIDAGVVAAGASRGTVTRLVDGGQTFELLASVGYAPNDMEQWARFANTPDLPLGAAASTRLPVVVRDATDPAAGARFPVFQSWPKLTGMRAGAIFPLVTGTGTTERVHGVIAFEFDEPRAFPADELEFYGVIAQMCAQAMDRASAYETELALRAEAEHARQIADEANRAKADFLTTMSHELRTPLNAIAGYVDLMQLGVPEPVPGAHQEYLTRIQRSQSHLLGLINEVLSYARIEAGRVDYDIADLSVCEVLASIQPLIEPQARAKGHTYYCAPCDERLRVRADRDKLAQILLNLVSNAVKFTPSGGTITLKAERLDPSTVVIRVSDTGPGIPSDKLEAIFDPFVQLDGSRTRTSDGTGLGLAISRDLARGMGGDLVANGAPNRGSEFTLSLPVSLELEDGAPQ